MAVASAGGMKSRAAASSSRFVGVGNFGAAPKPPWAASAPRITSRAAFTTVSAPATKSDAPSGRTSRAAAICEALSSISWRRFRQASSTASITSGNPADPPRRAGGK